MMSAPCTFDEAAAYDAYLARLPEDCRARLNEPVPGDFKAPQGFTHLKCKLAATDPTREASRFVVLRLSLPAVETEWSNMLESNRWTGGGTGFPDVKGRPHVQALAPAPAQLPQLIPMGRFFVASRPVGERA